MKTILKILAILIIAIIISLGGSYFYVSSNLNHSPNPDSSLTIHIEPNTTISGIIDQLNDNGALKPKWMYKLLIKISLSGRENQIDAGYYSFPEKMTNKEILRGLFSDKFLSTIRITYPEGISYKKFAEITAKKLNIDKNKFLRLCESDSILRAYKIPAENVEGYLKADTYEFFQNASALKVIDKLLKTGEKVWIERFAEESVRIGLTRHEALTLASIIEAESPVDEERPTVSGVYHNRLERGMLLQADPTVQYAIGEKRRLLYTDLTYNHPYNTYVYAGLPPGPINCPGETAIEAAVNPQKHNYLFFVAVGDGSGRHNFSRTLAEHNRYKSQFKRNVRNSNRD